MIDERIIDARRCALRRITWLADVGLCLALTAAMVWTPARAAPGPAEAMPKYRALAPDAIDGDLVVWGNDALQQVMDIWQESFTRLYPAVRIHSFLRSTGSAVGALYTGTAQIGFFGREISRDELATWRRIFSYPPLEFTVGSGSYDTFAKTVAVAVLVNKNNPLEHISLRQLDAMYSRDRERGAPGAITTWGELGLAGEWSGKPIRIFGLDEETGTAQYFRTIVMKDGHWSCNLELPPGAPKGKYAGSGGDASEKLVKALEADPAAIGLGGFRNVNPRLKALAISEDDDAGPFIAGTRAMVADRSYPLSRKIYIFVNKDPAKDWDPKIREFLRYVLSDRGQDDIRREGDFLPLPAAMVAQESAKLR